MLRHFLITFANICLLSFSYAQNQPTSPATTQSPPVTAEQIKSQALGTLIETIRNEEKERDTQRELLKKAASDEQKKEINDQIERISLKIKDLKNEFSNTATGINPTDAMNDAPQAMVLNDELKNIFQPLVRELRDATAQPREIDNLSNELLQWHAKESIARAAITQLDQLLSLKNSAELNNELNSLKKTWRKRLLEAEGRAANTSIQLEERKRNAPSVFGLLTNLVSHFFKNRGLSLLLALGSSLIVWYLCRRLYQIAKKYSPIHRKYYDSFTTRLLDIFVNIVVILIGFAAAILILYMRNDWLLLTAALILLFGLAWGSRNAIPPYFEQIRLILNLGTVRVDERVIINGLPWRVDSLNFFCELSNPELTGGKLRLAAKTILPLYSRPSAPKEPWFPSRLDDWVKLEDGTIGKVIQQTPEQVVLVKIGGSYKTLLTSAYLAKNPENLSRQFRVSTVFGLDYRYQKIAIKEIPEIIRISVLKSFVESYSTDLVKSVNVDFAKASCSSLDFYISLDVDGILASQHDVLVRLLQRAAVEASNQNNWLIPYPQLTIHQNKDSSLIDLDGSLPLP
jgi:small-conductance mechanosensitive channel